MSDSNENGSTFRVLVVEDNPHVTELFSYALKRLGQELLGGDVVIDLHEASDGHQAWTRLDAGSEGADFFDLVVLDLMLPVLDGLEVLSRIRAKPSLASLPVLVVTAASVETCQEAADAGATDVLRKPVQLSRIRSALERILS